jgi:hypothetical protein
MAGSETRGEQLMSILQDAANHQTRSQLMSRIVEIETALATAERERDEAREALIQVSDMDWGWQGGGSDRRYRGRYGEIAADALGIPERLPDGWPDHTHSETRTALNQRGKE